MVVVWNALFLTDMWCSKQHSVKFCPLALAAFVLFSAAPILILRFPALGHLLLKPGRRVGEIRHYLLFECALSALFVVVILLYMLGIIH